MTEHAHTQLHQSVSRSVVSNSFATQWTIAHQAPLSMGFSRQEYWRGLPFSPPGDLPDPGIETMSPALQAVSLLLNHWGSPYVCVLVTQSCPTLCDPMDCSLQGSSVHEIFQARILEWVAISFSRRSSQPGDQTRVSCIAGRRFTV